MHAHDRGLSHDLPMILERSLGRRGLLSLLGAAGAAALVGCTDQDGSGSEEIPEETAGPFPANGTNGVGVLGESGIVRQDLTTSFGTGTATAEGVPLRLRMRIREVEGDDLTVPAGAAVYVWHCDREGRYSMYSTGVEQENYLRGVQVVDGEGWVEFATVFPGAYPGRWPHVHFEVYTSLGEATRAGGKLSTSQLAFPEDACREAYGAEGYADSADHLAETPLDDDLVFADGYDLQMARLSGDNEQGWAATLEVAV